MIDNAGKTHPALNLVASDLFFGLGAVMLVVVAALSLGLQNLVAKAMSDQTATPHDTRAAATALATGQTVLLADDQGLHRLSAGTDNLISLDDLWQSDRLADWFAEEPLLVIAASGQEAAFLAFSRAAETHPAALATLRLTQDCRQLQLVGETVQCQP